MGKGDDRGGSRRYAQPSGITLGYLLDTHTFLWAAIAPEKLSHKARRICEAPSKALMVSVVTLWEVFALVEAGKLEMPAVGPTLSSWIETLGASVLAVDEAHVMALYGLPLLHRDTFDRVLVSQAKVESLALVTKDENIHRYEVKCVW